MATVPVSEPPACMMPPAAIASSPIFGIDKVPSYDAVRSATAGVAATSVTPRTPMHAASVGSDIRPTEPRKT
jgi:hypothetical protein